MHAYLRSVAGPRSLRVGPFVIRFDDHDDALPFNYAIPDDDAAPTADDIGELVAAFRSRARTPRLEYVPSAAPKVEEALAGFTPEGRFPLMVCGPGEVTDVPVAGVAVSLVTEDADLWQVARVMNAAFDAPAATEHDVARMRRVLDSGGLVACATDTATGEAAGGGQLGSPHLGVAEVAGIAVLPAYRRRGIAGAVTALLTRAGGAAGITTPFLTPGSDEAGRVYARVGYRKVGEMLHTSLR